MDIVIVVQAQTPQPGSLTFGNPLQRIAVREVGVSGAVLLVQILVFSELVVFQVRRLRPRLETVQGPFLAGGRRAQMTALDRGCVKTHRESNEEEVRPLRLRCILFSRSG